MKTKKELTLADLRNVRGALGGDTIEPISDTELRVAEDFFTTEEQRAACESRGK